MLHKHFPCNMWVCFINIGIHFVQILPDFLYIEGDQLNFTHRTIFKDLGSLKSQKQFPSLLTGNNITKEKITKDLFTL